MKNFMSESLRPKVRQKLEFVTKPTVVDGASVNVKYVDVCGQTLAVSRRGPISVVGLEDDWYEDLNDPAGVINGLRRNSGFKPDIFTFWQRLPNIEPKYPFHMERESIAVLRIESYDHWLNKQIKGSARNKIRKSEKAGVQVREVAFDDDFVRGVVKIFNETPTRQGRRFWHYGKDFATVKSQFSRFLFREDLIGAYYQNELIGFVMLGNAGNHGVLGQIISMVSHRDKATNNALMAKSVEICAEKEFSYLVYAFWSDSTLADFKRFSGFEEVKLPRYFVPLTQKGKLALKLGLHRGWKAAVPDKIKNPLKQIRRSWYSWRAQFASDSPSPQ
jgi:hypothetical protein